MGLKKFLRLIGVAAVDATLEEIENILTAFQWGDVYSFLINKQGEAIFHPSLSATARQNVKKFNLILKLFYSISKILLIKKICSLNYCSLNRLLKIINCY